MPLTFAHPAAVLPLARLGLPLSALAVGSLAPDLIYFARLAPRGGFGHTLPGLVAFCLPAGVALLAVADLLLKRPLAELAPVSAQRRLAAVLARSPFHGPLVGVMAAVLVGAATHVGWDAFTHAGGWGVGAVPALGETIGLGPLGAVPAFKLAQHGSTLVGLVVLAVAGGRWWRRAPQADVQPRLSARARAVRAGGLAAGALAFGVASASAQAAGAASPVPVFVGRFVIATTTAAFVLAVAYSAWTRATGGHEQGSWKAAFDRAAAAVRAERGVAHRFGPPATAAALAALERHLGMELPPDLRAMLAEFDGIAVCDPSWGSDWQPLVFSVDEMLRDVPAYLAESGNPTPPADELARVAFVAHRNGFADLFAVCLRPVGGFRPGEVLRLDHETGAFSRAEPSLRAFVASPRYPGL